VKDSTKYRVVVLTSTSNRSMAARNILITGSNGQIGTNLSYRLQARYPECKIVMTDLHPNDDVDFEFDTLDVLDLEKYRILVESHDINEIYHLAAILSAAGEKRPEMAWHVNFQGLVNTLNIAREFNCKVFWPSSIAVFGPSTPRVDVPQQTVCEPTTVYGISKYTGELWCQYYHLKYGIDVRSLRFPGLISWKGEPGGGTTDYAVEIFHDALLKGSYTCFLKPDTFLPMLYMDDALDGIIDLMEVDGKDLSVRTSYNISAMSFSPQQLARVIREFVPDFTMHYEVDSRQEIADSWPQSLHDNVARTDWNWNPKFDIEKMVEDMISHLREK